MAFTWWMRDDNQREHVVGHNHNPKYLQSVVIDNNIVTATTDLKLTIEESDVLVIATPSAFIDETFLNFSKEDFAGKYIISAVKGIIPQTNEIPAIISIINLMFRLKTLESSAALVMQKRLLRKTILLNHCKSKQNISRSNRKQLILSLY